VCEREQDGRRREEREKERGEGADVVGSSITMKKKEKKDSNPGTIYPNQIFGKDVAHPPDPHLSSLPDIFPFQEA